MKDLVMRLLKHIAQLLRRFADGAPSNTYEKIFFDALRAAVAVAVFPPGRIRDAAV